MKILEAKKKFFFYQVYPSIAPPINLILKQNSKIMGYFLSYNSPILQHI